MVSEATVQFLALSFSEGKRLGMFSDAIPHSFNKLNALLDAQAQDFFKLGWAHAPKFTPASARMQSVRITPRLSCGARAQPAIRHGPPARRQLEPVVSHRHDFQIEARDITFHASACRTTRYRAASALLPSR